MTRVRPTLAAAVAAIAILPVALGEAVFVEEWEDGLAAWSVEGDGAAVDCAVGLNGCSLRLDAACCDAYTFVTRGVGHVMQGPTNLTFAFRASAVEGDSDTEVHVTLDAGGKLTLTPTDSFGPNNLVTLVSEGHNSSSFYEWQSSNAWYLITIVVDPDGDRAYAVMRTAQGVLLARSPDLPIPAESSAVESVRLQVVQWPGVDVTFHYDALSLARGAYAPPEPLPPGAPRFLHARPGFYPGTVLLDWMSPTSTGGAPLDFYRVYRSADGESWDVVAEVAGTSFDDVDLMPLDVYRYRVTAESAVGEGAPSHERCTRAGPSLLGTDWLTGCVDVVP